MPIPRKRIWLIILIWLVVLINLLYFGLMRTSYKDKLIQRYVIDYLAEVVGAEVEIGNLSFSDKFLMIEGFSFELAKANVTIKAESIHAEYDLMQFLWNRIQKKPFAKNIYLNKPYVKYHFGLKDRSDKEKQETKDEAGNAFPPLERFFEKVYIYEGEVEFSLDVKAYKLKERFSQLNGNLQTLDGITAHLDGKTDNQGDMSVDIDLSGGKFNDLTAEVKDYQPVSMYITQIDTLIADYDIKFNYKPGLMSLDTGLKDVYLEVANLKIKADSLDLLGDGNELNFEFYQPLVDSNPVNLSGTLLNTFSSEIGVDASLTAEGVEVSSFQSILEGKADLEARMQGRFTDFAIDARAEGNNLELAGQRLDEVVVSARIGNHDLDVNIEHLAWQQNDLKGSGFLGYDMTMLAEVEGDSIVYNLNGIEIRGDLNAFYSSKTKDISHFELDDVSISSSTIDLDRLGLDIYYEPPELRISLHRTYNDLSLSSVYDLEEKAYSGKLQMRRFKLSSIFDELTLPYCTGQLSFNGDMDSLSTDSQLRFYDQHFGSFNGKIASEAKLNFKTGKSYLKLSSSDFSYNYQDLKVDLIAEGNADSIITREFSINDKVDIQAGLYRKDKPHLEFDLSARDLEITDVLKYIVDHHDLDEYQGVFDLDISADSEGEGSYEVRLEADSLEAGSVTDLQLILELAGTTEKIELKNCLIKQFNRQLGHLQGNIGLEEGFNAAVEMILPEVNLTELTGNSKLQGICKANTEFLFRDGAPGFELYLEGENLSIYNNAIEQVTLDINQSDSRLTVNELEIRQKPDNNLSANGAIGYNLITNRSYQDNNRLNIEFSGNLSGILDHNIEYLEKATGNTEINLELSMGENGIDINTGEILINKGKIKLKDQPDEFENIKLELSVSENVFTVLDFFAKIGNGKLYIENSVGYNEADIRYNDIIIGQLLVSTSSNGIEFYFPEYSIPGTLSHIKIQGRDSHYLRLFMENDQPLILGDMIISGADIIYPPNTDNLMQIFNSLTADLTDKWNLWKKKKQPEVNETVYEDDYNYFPMNIDLYVETAENVRYVTYPFEVEFTPGSYINLLYSDGKLSIPNANFDSEDGKIVLVGTELEVNNISLSYIEQQNTLGLEAVFDKKTADGTLIQLVITDDREGSFPNNLEMTILSDNQEDKTDTEKLFRLRYGRSLDNISADERKTLFEDDLIQTAGGEIENMVIDPVINQFEAYISRLLNIDYFQMETSFIYNLLSNNDELYGNQEEADKKYSSDVLLENLSLKAGKYVLDDLFLNYDVTFQKAYETELETEMGVYHTVSFRYDMPLNIKFVYEYKIDPYNQDSHEYSFKRTVPFTNLMDLWNKVVHPYSGTKRQ